jgi:serine protease
VNTAAGQPCLFSLDTTSNSGATGPANSIYTDQLNANLGTSFSAPIVSGIAGLMLAVNPSLKSPQLIARLKEGASPYPTTSDNANVPTCHVPTSSSDVQSAECICTTSACGAGMANANGAVRAALRPLATIVVQGSVAAGASLTLQGSSSTAATGHAITQYSWTKGGTSLGTGPSVGFTVPASRTSSVCLTVTDDAGKQDTAKVVISQSSADVSLVPAGTDACVEVSIAATDSNAAEAGADPGTFTITRAGGSMAAALTISLSFSGTATAGTDYQALASSVVIPAGAATANLTVTPIDDTVVDAAETVSAMIQSGTGYDIGSANSATITIADNDSAAAPPTSSTTDSGGKGGGGGAFDTLTLVGMVGFAILAVRRRLGIARQAATQRRAWLRFY